MTLTIQFANQEVGAEGEQRILITENLFGGNLLITNARAGELTPVSGYGRAIGATGIVNLRYPGGSVTEQYFDMNRPDAPVTGGTPLIGQSEFLSYAAEIGVSATIVIPTRCAFDESAAEALDCGHYGDRDVAAAYRAQVDRYVFNTIQEASRQHPPVSISTLEIGNEFWASGEMTATEYGRVAAAALRAAQAAIDRAIDQGIIRVDEAPALVVQTVSAAGYMSPNYDTRVYISDGNVYRDPPNTEWHSAMIDGQGNARTQLNDIIEELIQDGAAQLVDGVVDHYYNVGGLAAVDDREQFLFNQFTYFERELGLSAGALDRYVTEWNTRRTVDAGGVGNENNVEVSQNRGLPQAGMLIEMFYEMVTHGVSAANIWPLWFPGQNSTSLFDSTTFAPRIPVAIFDLMQESLVGTAPIFDNETVVGNVHLDTHGFFGSNRLVLFAQNRGQTIIDDFIINLESVVDVHIRDQLAGMQYFISVVELSATLEGVVSDGADGEDVMPVTSYSDGFVSSGAGILIEPSMLNSDMDPLLGSGLVLAS